MWISCGYFHDWHLIVICWHNGWKRSRLDISMGALSLSIFVFELDPLIWYSYISAVVCDDHSMALNRYTTVFNLHFIWYHVYTLLSISYISYTTSYIYVCFTLVNVHMNINYVLVYGICLYKNTNSRNVFVSNCYISFRIQVVCSFVLDRIILIAVIELTFRLYKWYKLSCQQKQSLKSIIS